MTTPREVTPSGSDPVEAVQRTPRECACTLADVSDQSKEEGAPRLDLNLPDELAGGVWANFAVVSHSPYEFTIDFARLDFGRGSPEEVPGVVVSRVNLSPLMVSQLLDALQENWRKYAARALPREVHDDGSEE